MGCHRVFGYPGDGINGFLGAFEKVEEPVFTQTRHEEMAAFMACAHAKFTGEIGVCMATSGPGTIHLINGCTRPTGACCGLAGSWGLEKGKYDVSIDCGEQALLPAVREASDSTFVVADGFSCKTQIEESGSGRRAMHLGEVVQFAHSARRAPGQRSEVALDDGRPSPGLVRRAARTALPAIGIPAAGAIGATTGRRVLRN